MYLTVRQRDALLAHVPGPVPVNISSAVWRTTSFLIQFGLVSTSKPHDTTNSGRPRYTYITEEGRWHAVALLADEADAFDKLERQGFERPTTTRGWILAALKDRSGMSMWDLAQWCRSHGYNGTRKLLFASVRVMRSKGEIIDKEHRMIKLAATMPHSGPEMGVGKPLGEVASL